MANTRGTDRIPTPSVRATARQALLTGFALTIPLFVTLLVIGFVVNSLSNVLDPVVTFAFQLTGSRLEASETPAALVKMVAVVVLLVSVFCIGFVAERRSGPGRIESVFDATIERIPGVGSLYTSFDEMSKMLLDSDTQSFQEVVLVEHPTSESYTVAFVTASTPEAIERATGNDEMVTLFMPMAPNPVMGGHVIHVPTGKVYDVDMTVEEGLRSIVTSGVAIGDTDGQAVVGSGPPGADSTYPPQSQYHPDTEAQPTPSDAQHDRRAAYSDHIDAQHADTPESVARRGGDGTVGSETETPGDIEPPGEEQG